ncbi:phage protease [Mesorhizobium sp. 1M-11]|uniref:phage protease n=1 Tax=Mesorhizobium sp. 1M-11 TaxID=1529006 RepID=UPI0006C76BB0|nr:phage protease [Mesorhizobium sp. 1M-11]
MNMVLNAITHSLSAAANDGKAPEYIHLLPAGTFSGADGRGPFVLGDVAELIAVSLPAGRKLPIDVNHAIDHLAGTGRPSPAVAWIVALEGRADGVWGKVEWTNEGRSLVADRKYGFISPVFNTPKTKPHRVLQLLRASLTNDPNLTLTALHSKTTNGDPSMDEELRKALGLPETADQAAILAAVTSAHSASTAMATIAKAAGLAENAGADDIVTAIQERAGDDDEDAEKAELREQVKELNTRLTTEVTTNAKKRAEAFVEKAIEDGKLVPALRERFIARHMKDPADVEAEIKLMPSLHSGGLGKRRSIEGDADGLSDTDATVCEMMGLDPKEFAKTAAAIQKEVH